MFVEENVDEITFYIPYNDGISLSNIRSRGIISRTDTTAEFREIRKKCEEIKKSLRTESETESESLYSSLENIQKLLDRTKFDIIDTMDNAKNLLKSNKNMAATDDPVTTNLAVMNDIKTNTQYYLDHLGISISRVLTQTLDPLNKDHGSMHIVEELIRKLELNESGDNIGLLEAAQRKVMKIRLSVSLF